MTAEKNEDRAAILSADEELFNLSTREWEKEMLSDDDCRQP